MPESTVPAMPVLDERERQIVTELKYGIAQIEARSVPDPAATDRFLFMIAHLLLGQVEQVGYCRSAQ